MTTGLLRARDSFVGAALSPNGQSIEVNVYAGQVVRGDHLAVAGREHLFEPLDPDAEPTPTSAPRGRTRASRNIAGGGVEK